MKNTIANKKRLTMLILSILSAFFFSWMILGTLSNSSVSVDAASATQTQINPIAHYKFDDATNVGKDSIGNYNLSSYGTPTATTDNNVACVDFDTNSCLYFNHVNNKDFTDVLPQFTITYWAKHDTVQSGHSFTIGSGAANSYEGFGQGFYAGNNAFITPVGNVMDSGAYAASFRTSAEDSFGPYADNYSSSKSWNFFAFKYVSPSEIYYSVNGYVYKVPNDNGTINAKIANLSQTFTIGGIINNASQSFFNGFDGKIADLRIYAAAIDNSQIKSLADAGANSTVQVTTSGLYIKDVDASSCVYATAKDEQSILSAAYNTEVKVTLSDNSTKTATVFWDSVSYGADKITVSGVVSCDGAANIQNTRVNMEVIIQGGIKTSYTFTDNAILQRGKAIIYGTADENVGTVKVTYGDTVKQSTVSDYAWSVDLNLSDAVLEGKPLIVEYAKNDVNYVKINEYSNVRVGEVWLCSGQSNMAITIDYIAGKDNTVNGLYSTATNWKNISIFNIPYTSASTPADSVNASWVVPSSLNEAKNVSALATAYAVQLQSVLEDVPVGIIVSAVGGSCIEEWIDSDTMKTLPSHAEDMSKTKTYLYNGMIHPLAGYGIKGILWYQGEANVLFSDDYAKQFKAYAKKYRQIFNDDSLPIITVQLPQFCDWTTWTDFREMQWNLQKEIENLYVVCTIDLGDNTSPYKTSSANDCIHPSDKWYVALRTTGLSAVKIYNITSSNSTFDIPYDVSPYAVSAESTKKGILIKTSQPIVNKGDSYKGFWICVGNSTWERAEAEWTDGNLLIRTSQKATAVRYLYEDVFEDNFGFARNSAGLPLAPFKNIDVTALSEFDVTISTTDVNGSTTTDTRVAKAGEKIDLDLKQIENVSVKVIINNQEIQITDNKCTVTITKETSIKIIYTKTNVAPTPEPSPEKTGCNSQINVLSQTIILSVLLLGLVFIVKKTKKN